MIAVSPPVTFRATTRSAPRGMLPPVMFGLAGFIAISHVEASIEAVGSSLALSAVLLAVAAMVGLWARWTARELGRAALLTGAVAFSLLAAIWVCSRTAGLPFGISPRAPVGVLDAATALDEVLLAAAVLVIRASGRRSGNLLSLVGFAAISASFMLMSMGCSVGTSRPASGALSAEQGVPLYCHLY